MTGIGSSTSQPAEHCGDDLVEKTSCAGHLVRLHDYLAAAGHLYIVGGDVNRRGHIDRQGKAGQSACPPAAQAAQ